MDLQSYIEETGNDPQVHCLEANASSILACSLAAFSLCLCMHGEGDTHSAPLPPPPILQLHRTFPCCLFSVVWEIHSMALPKLEKANVFYFLSLPSFHLLQRLLASVSLDSTVSSPPGPFNLLPLSSCTLGCRRPTCLGPAVQCAHL